MSGTGAVSQAAGAIGSLSKGTSMAHAVLVPTSTDFEQTIRVDGHVHPLSMVRPLPEVEGVYREAIDAIFEHLDAIDPADP